MALSSSSSGSEEEWEDVELLPFGKEYVHTLVGALLRCTVR